MNGDLFFRRTAAVATVLILAALPCAAEICWDYTDFELAKVPLKCVQMGDGVTPCSWNTGGETCNEDLNPNDCCMAVHDPGATQTIGEMHVAWHTCLGDVGTDASPPPPNRGLRWYAFHRQLESDFNVYREGLGFDKIDSLQWCPGMNMPYGHFGAGMMPGTHPLGCGTGNNRPNNIACDGCETFRECLYVSGAGPGGSCAGSPASAGCTIDDVSFPYTELQDFQNVDEVATLLDVYFHGDMHGAVADADFGGYNTDCADPNCSTRDGMFWRLHKALDDVVRAWQDLQAVDVTLVIDRSGSMGGASGTGVGTRMDNAIEAADMFADLLEEGRSDGGVNRIGIVSYSSNASNAALNMPLQDVDMNLRDPAGPFATTLGALSPGGSTSIGAGMVEAVNQLCPGGSCATHIPGPGENERKAVLLLTDGKENTAPCLMAGCQSGGGAEIDYTTLDVMQMCAVGLGNAASINGELLTMVAERQGGIYLNNTDATGDDLKDFFAKCFAQLTDEFIGLDPAGLLAAGDPAGPIVPYESCDDQRVTFTSGWTRSNLAGDRLRLLVTTPDGDAWSPAGGAGEMSDEQSWAFKRSPLPYRGQAEGTWSMQLLRPQRAFANGFTTDSFVDQRQGVRIVRRQIQRLCPIGASGKPSCRRVLYFEDGALRPSAYAHALESESGVSVGDVKAVTEAPELTELLRDDWDLIVYARQAGADQDEPYDSLLARRICAGTPAIVTDTRSGKGAAAILRCARAEREPEVVNWKYIEGTPEFMKEKVPLLDPGHKIFSYGLRPLEDDHTAASAAAFFRIGVDKRDPAAIVSSALRGSDLNWHKNVLVTGLSQLTAFAPRTVPLTGQPLKAAVRILPSFYRAGGYPGAKATVTVKRPIRGLGGLVPKVSGEPYSFKEDPIHPVEQALHEIRIETTKDVFELNDDGKNGDEHPGNGTYSADLPISAAVDGMYTFHYIFEYPSATCTTRRELKQSLFVAVKVSPPHSQVDVGEPKRTRDGKVFPVRIRPQDALGNIVGPGRQPRLSCQRPCACETKDVVDNNDGSYTIPLKVPESYELSACSLDFFGAHFTFGPRQKYPSRRSVDEASR